VAHSAQGQNLKKLSEVIEDFNALPAVRALARVLIKLVWRTSGHSAAAWSPRLAVWSSMKMKVATFLLEDRKLPPNEAISADKRAYSRAVLVNTDAVALLQDSG
jgi:hypothetical protein